MYFKTKYFYVYCVECVWNVMAHAQKPDCVFRQNGRVHLNWQGRQFSRLLAAVVCASAVVMLDTPSEVVWRVLATHCIRQFPLHLPSHASLCAIMFQLDSTFNYLAIQVIAKPYDLIEVTTSHTEWWYIPEEHSTAVTTTLPFPPSHLNNHIGWHHATENLSLATLFPIITPYLDSELSFWILDPWRWDR